MENFSEILPGATVYAASKAESERQAYKWAQENQPSFKFNTLVTGYNVRDSQMHMHVIINNFSDWLLPYPGPEIRHGVYSGFPPRRNRIHAGLASWYEATFYSLDSRIPDLVQAGMSTSETLLVSTWRLFSTRRLTRSASSQQRANSTGPMSLQSCAGFTLLIPGFRTRQITIGAQLTTSSLNGRNRF